MRRLVCAGLLLVVLLAIGAPAGAQEVATIADLDGQVELGRAGVWSPAAIGTAVFLDDALRTGRPGRVRITFREGSVLTMADGSEVTINEQVFEADRGWARSTLRLLRGKVRALVAEYYERPGSAFQIETATAVAGVRGSEFVIAYDPVTDSTDAVGVGGQVAINSVRDLVGHRVIITAHDLTVVRRGQFPTPVRRLDEPTFRQYIEGLEFVGGGRPESLTRRNSLLSGEDLPPQDRAMQVMPPLGTVLSGERSPLSDKRSPLTKGQIRPWDQRWDPPPGIESLPQLYRGGPGDVGVNF
jgi:hypothetical protein